MSERDKWIWLAALLEGEGSFNVASTGGSLRITIGMTDKDTINTAARIMSNHVKLSKRRGTSPEGKSCKDVYRFEISGERAAFVARKILPFMHTRRRQKIQSILREWYKRILKRYGIVCRRCGACDPTYAKFF
jgi:hypothetical protein